MEPSIRDEYQHMSTFFYFIVTTKGDLHEIENINYFFFFIAIQTEATYSRLPVT